MTRVIQLAVPASKATLRANNRRVLELTSAWDGTLEVSSAPRLDYAQSVTLHRAAQAGDRKAMETLYATVERAVLAAIYTITKQRNGTGQTSRNRDAEYKDCAQWCLEKALDSLHVWDCQLELVPYIFAETKDHYADFWRSVAESPAKHGMRKKPKGLAHVSTDRTLSASAGASTVGEAHGPPESDGAVYVQRSGWVSWMAADPGNPIPDFWDWLAVSGDVTRIIGKAIRDVKSDRHRALLRWFRFHGYSWNKPKASRGLVVTYALKSNVDARTVRNWIGEALAILKKNPAIQDVERALRHDAKHKR